MRETSMNQPCIVVRKDADFATGSRELLKANQS